MVRRVGLLLVTAALAALPAAAQSFGTAVPAPDGTLLATDVYLPLSPPPAPVVLIRTPYGKQGLRDTCTALTLLGYACVAQDVRGRYGSQGQNSVFRDDGPDGRATLDWIASQPWCNGRIGTLGGSALGITQLALAPFARQELACIMPVVATMDFYHHAAYQGGALREELLHTWLAGQNALEFYDLVRQHRLWDDWWQAVALLPHLGDVHVPGLHVGGWFDIFAQGTLDAFMALQRRGGEGAQGRQFLVIGPWTHGTVGTRRAGELTYPANAVLDLPGLIRDWLDHWLKGRDRGVEGWAPVRIYLMGEVGEAAAPGNVWLDLPDWPPAFPVTTLFLAAHGSLAEEAGAPATVPLPIDPADPVPTLGGANLFPDLLVAGRPQGAGPMDQRPVEGRSDVLVFSTPPLAAPLTVIGRVVAHIWLLPDTPDLDLAVRLTDVYPDGRSMLVTDGIQRARKRCGDDQECLLTPGEPAELVVDVGSTALVVNAGHRLRLVVSGSNWPRFEVNPCHGGDLSGNEPPRPARPLLLCGRPYPSRLELPVPPTPSSPRLLLRHR